MKKLITRIILKDELDAIIRFYKEVYDSFNDDIGLTVYLTIPTMFDEFDCSYICFTLSHNHEIRYMVKDFTFAALNEDYHFEYHNSTLLILNFKKFRR